MYRKNKLMWRDPRQGGPVRNHCSGPGGKRIDWVAVGKDRYGKMGTDMAVRSYRFESCPCH